MTWILLVHSTTLDKFNDLSVMEKVLHNTLEKSPEILSPEDTKRNYIDVQKIIKELDEEAHPTEPVEEQRKKGSKKKTRIQNAISHEKEGFENGLESYRDLIQEPRTNIRRLSFHQEERSPKNEMKRKYSLEDERSPIPEPLPKKELSSKKKNGWMRQANEKPKDNNDMISRDEVEQKATIKRKTTTNRKTYAVTRTTELKSQTLPTRAKKISDAQKMFFLKKVAPLKEVLEKERAKEAEKEASLRKRPQTMRPNEHINNTFSPYRPIKLNDILEDETKHEMMLIQKKREQIIKSYHIKAKISLLTSLLY